MARPNYSRAELERKAIEECPAEMYYELLDVINEEPDENLWSIIEQPQKELAKHEKASEEAVFRAFQPVFRIFRAARRPATTAP